MNKNILTFHQIAPLHYKQLHAYLQQDPLFDHFLTYSPSTISTYLRCSVAEATRYQQQFSAALQKDVRGFYEQQHIHVVCYGDEAYPTALYDIYDPPLILYVKGDVRYLNEPALAIVGSRKATSYSRTVIDAFMPYCKEAGIVIVSGVAKGADSFAHAAALMHDCPTIGVLGHGFHYMYPREHATLAEEIATRYALVTEYPYYAAPQKWHFPMRNRLISGLSEAIVVTEAERKSGTMSTVDYALSHGKDIYAVPGNIFSPLSASPNALIAEGATALTLEEMPRILQHFQHKN